MQSERQNAYTVGLQQALGSKVRLDFDYWWRDSKNAGDQDQFLTTGIVFPISFASGHYQGWDLRLDLAPTDGFRGYVSAGHVHAIYDPPPAGGLFLDQGSVDSITGAPFLIDHDQKLQIQAGVYYDVGEDRPLARGQRPLRLGPRDRRRPGGAPAGSGQRVRRAVRQRQQRDGARSRIGSSPARSADFQVGYDLAKVHIPVQLQFMILNAFDTKGVYNILSVFGGTHVIPPRRFVGQALFTF